MYQIAILTATLSLGAWIYLLAFHGRFWRADQRLEAALPAPQPWPEVVAVIPARNEAKTIAPVIRSHLESAYPGRYSVVLVDDQSCDGTGQIAESVAEDAVRPVIVLRASTLEPGWTGKLHALDFGLGIAADRSPSARYFLLTDADIVHGPEILARLVAKAEQDDLALVSLMAKLDSRGLWGTLLVPAFVFFFQKLYPFPQVNRATDPTAAAAGGCVLVRCSVLREVGGLEAIKGALIDDCALARLVKGRPPARRIWLGLADDVASLRDNRGLGSIWSMVARTAYTQLDYSPLLLLGTILGMALVYLAGPLAALTLPLHGSALAAALGAAAWAAMAVAYVPTLTYYRKPPPVAAALPLCAALYLLMTLTSALRHWRGEGGAWKGRTYSRHRPPRPT